MTLEFFQINWLEPSLVDAIDTTEDDFDVGEVMTFFIEPCEELIWDSVTLGVGEVVRELSTGFCIYFGGSG